MALVNEPSAELTSILHDLARGRRDQVDVLLAALYDDLRRLAAYQLKQERGNHTLQATALVHEAWMRLIDQTRVEWRDRAHFLGVASHVIRRILVDHARAHLAEKRGGGRRQFVTTGVIDAAPDRRLDLLGLDDALRDLAEISAEQAEIVELRFFGGLTIDEVAEVTGIPKRSVDREWACAKAWLFRELEPDGAPPGEDDDGSA